MTRHVALLRGINVGKHKRIGMAPLREALTARGYTDVVTHLQSGNVILTAAERSPHSVAADLSAAIADGFGFDVPVVVRSRAQLQRVVDRNPLADVMRDPARLLVTFFDPAPPATALDGLDARAFEPERFVLDGAELYAWFDGGVHASPAGRALERLRLPGTATARNWNTVLKLLDLTR